MMRSRWKKVVESGGRTIGVRAIIEKEKARRDAEGLAKMANLSRLV
jgi:hypothetical protein